MGASLASFNNQNEMNFVISGFVLHYMLCNQIFTLQTFLCVTHAQSGMSRTAYYYMRNAGQCSAFS
jgi:small neutral amino acid transporter SnatA (MarC family)